MDSPDHRWRAPTGPLVPRPDAARFERAGAIGSFLATAVSVVLVHRWNAGGWADAVVFCVALLAILGAHELGHHVVGRRHGLRLSLPVFLPAPFFVGTLGALIQVRDRPRSRTALLEMGAAGPLAGFAVITVLVALHLAFGAPDATGEPLARPLVWQAIGWATTGGAPPLSTADPVGYAAWVGCLVTAMNLLPIGTLDGGHVLAAVDPRRSRWVGWIATGGLVALGIAWPPWWAWAAATRILAWRAPAAPVGVPHP
ncbi:MAG: site-2 protease family protein, partial [Myxococcota bacterium]